MYKVSSLQVSSHRSELSETRLQYLKPYHGARLVEPLLGEVNPSRWTNVISDKQLYRRLLEAYILFQYSSCPVFQKELFLQDMVHGRTTFCSPLLVNTVLACATQACADIPDRTKFWLPRSLQYQFLAEAKRLLELESGTSARLTTLQAITLLNFTLNMNGMDEQ
ncbi:hypothetical protein K491DRAFT_72640 [Lophiostoma macrostomum CBS 122681]|uniref:Xylanolytic transcriptional activator regulatory domain-containing protein n=1 Tax=Lophiostoma macrostomum CBS 122681 TaxID=1314788 RepID=A0A6A6SW08_9PLEO|nr:hypothetical protein K491DRAFT_72640 [Lophiostoma macrostomum CBS 122681]